MKQANDYDGYDVWAKVIDNAMAGSGAEDWGYFWSNQEPLSDAEFSLLKDLCYSRDFAPEVHELLFKLVNREVTLRIKNHGKLGISAVAV